MSKITFTSLQESHFPLLLKWLEMPHVKAWWDKDISWTAELIHQKHYDRIHGNQDSTKPVHGFIILHDNTQIGYIHYYNVHDDEWESELGAAGGALPDSCAGVDLYIGELEFIGKGLGSKALEQFVNEHVFPKFEYAFVDPNPINTSAIKAYSKAGFHKIDKLVDTKDVWMVKTRIPVVSTKTAPHFVWGNECDGWWLKNNGKFTVIEEVMPPGASEAKHYHEEVEQFFYVLEGALVTQMNDHDEYELQKGQGLTIFPGIVHQVFNKSKEPVRFLVISYPDSHEDRVDMQGNKNNVHRSYEKIIDWYDKHRSRDLFEKKWLDRAISYLSPGVKILDLGCGMGEPIASYLVSKGFDVTGVDGSVNMIELAKTRVAKGKFISCDMRGLNLNTKFDMVIAWHSFFHLTRDDQRAMFATFGTHLNDGGVLLFTAGPEDGEVWSNNGGENLYHASLASDEYKSLLESHDFKLLDYKFVDPDCGDATVWLAQKTQRMCG